MDSCEAALDSPLMYESPASTRWRSTFGMRWLCRPRALRKGWGKKLTYCIGFARDHVADVTKRYTQNFEDIWWPFNHSYSAGFLKAALRPRICCPDGRSARKRPLLTPLLAPGGVQ